MPAALPTHNLMQPAHPPTPHSQLHLTHAVYLAISIPPIFHATNHTVDAWLRALLPRDYGGLRWPWVQRLIVNCCTILTCLGVALGVPGESGTVLTVTGATGERLHRRPRVRQLDSRAGGSTETRRRLQASPVAGPAAPSGVDLMCAPLCLPRLQAWPSAPI